MSELISTTQTKALQCREKASSFHSINPHCDVCSDSNIWIGWQIWLLILHKLGVSLMKYNWVYFTFQYFPMSINKTKYWNLDVCKISLSDFETVEMQLWLASHGIHPVQMVWPLYNSRTHQSMQHRSLYTVLQPSYSTTTFIQYYSLHTVLHLIYSPTAFSQYHSFLTILQLSYSTTAFLQYHNQRKKYL